MRRVLILGALIALAGCNPEAKIVGDWGQQSTSNNLLANMAMQGGPKGKLTLNGDHKFIFETGVVRANPRDPLSAFNQGHTIEGTWSLADKEVTFQTETVDKQPVADFQAKEKEKFDQLSASFANSLTPSASSSDPSTPPPTPEEQAALDKLKGDLANLQPKLADVGAPIPGKGTLSDSFLTLTITTTADRKLEFGKRG